ncbi:MAG: hypothetical protein GY820_17065 [Gammaproteobacteria bacterium]|nr:hypothetical protein [Gammaproteobacteria bacterium]
MSLLDKLIEKGGDMATDVKSKGSEDFDFMGENEKTQVAGSKLSKKQQGIATSGNPKSSRKQKKAPVAPKRTGLTLAVVQEARKRACSPRGLDIEAFLQEFKLQNAGSLDIESLLNGPLPTEDDE